MTVAEIKKEKGYDVSIIILSVLVFASLITFIFSYKSIITLRHDIDKNIDIVDNEGIKNADLKNSIYKITDNISQEDFLANNGLILDKNPHYVGSTIEISYLTR